MACNIDVVRIVSRPCSFRASYSQNMFIDRPGHMRLGDFGLSTLAEDGPVHGCRGSLRYLIVCQINLFYSLSHIIATRLPKIYGAGCAVDMMDCVLMFGRVESYCLSFSTASRRGMWRQTRAQSTVHIGLQMGFPTSSRGIDCPQLSVHCCIGNFVVLFSHS